MTLTAYLNDLDFEGHIVKFCNIGSNLLIAHWINFIPKHNILWDATFSQSYRFVTLTP